MKLYTDADPADLEPEFSQHMEAMTIEGLNAKGAIAVQLALRDRHIASLVAAMAAWGQKGGGIPTDTPITKAYAEALAVHEKTTTDRDASKPLLTTKVEDPKEPPKEEDPKEEPPKEEDPKAVAADLKRLKS